MPNAAELIQEGNDCLLDGDFELAIGSYSTALGLLGTTRQAAEVFVNRATCYLNLLKFEKAFEDAGCAVQIDSKYGKAWFKLGAALVGLEHFSRAAVAFNKVLALEPTNQDAWEALQKMRIQQLYFPKCRDLNVSVMYINPNKKRAMYIKKKVQRNQILFTEKPAVSLKSYKSSNFIMCGYCLRSLITDDELVANFMKRDLLRTVHEFSRSINFKWPGHPDAPRVKCPHSEEVYCSDACRGAAWREFHQVLAPRKAEMARFYEYVEANVDEESLKLCLEVVLRICAMIVSSVKNGASLAEATDTFSFYEQKSSALLLQVQLEAIADHINEVIHDDKVQFKVRSDFLCSKLSQVALNIQSIEPTAVPHSVHVPLPHSVFLEHKELICKYAQIPFRVPNTEAIGYTHDSEEKEENDALRSEGGIGEDECKDGLQVHQEVIMTNLSVTQKPQCVGLYLLHTTVNHSCVPTCVMENTDTSELTVYATRDMDMGEEVTHCFVDMDLPYLKRIARLQYYGVQCNCVRCEEERLEMEIDERKKVLG